MIDLEQIRVNGCLVNIKDLSIGDWARRETKPPYTAEEVGAASQEQLDKVVSDISALKNYGTSNAGKILVVGADGKLTLTDMPIGGDGDIVGIVGENNAITLTGELADGTYVFKYENADGSYSEIGTLVVGGVVEYLLDVMVNHCTVVSASGSLDTIASGGTITITLEANDGYVLPENIEVNGASYTWDVTTGTVFLSNPTEDVVITIVAVEGEQPTYSITTKLTNCVGASDNATTIQYPQVVTLTFTANEGYEFPDNIVITNASSYNWNKETGELVISKAIGDITIAITATKGGYTNIIDTVGYKDGVRLSTADGVTEKSSDDTVNYTLTGMFTLENGSTIRTKGVNFNSSDYSLAKLYGYNAETEEYITAYGIVDGTNQGGWTMSVDAEGNATITKTSGTVKVRLGGYGSGENLIVTIDEEITE